MLYTESSMMERRRHARVPLDTAVPCIRLDPDAADILGVLYTVDISRGGMGALSDRPYYPGQRLILHLPRTAETPQRDICATIVRSRFDETVGKHRIGLAFDSVAMGAWCGVGVHAVAAA